MWTSELCGFHFWTSIFEIILKVAQPTSDIDGVIFDPIQSSHHAVANQTAHNLGDIAGLQHDFLGLTS